MKTTHASTAIILACVALALPAPSRAQSSRGWEDHVAATVEAQVRAQLKTLDQLDKTLSRLGDLRDLDALCAFDVSRALKSLDSLEALEGLGSLRSLGRLEGLNGLAALDALHARDRQQERGGGETERITKTFRVGRTGSLDLGNISGNVTVKAGAGEDIVIEATKRARDRANLANVRIDMTERTGRVEVRTVYTARNARVSVDYLVTVPAGASAVLHSVSGDVDVAGVKGAVRVDAISGSVRVSDGQQVQAVTTVSGDVSIIGGAAGDVRVETVSGKLTMRNVTVRSIEGTTISGDAELVDVTSGRTSLNAMSGDIACTCPLSANGRYTFKTHSGDVRLTLTSNTGFELNANTFNGDVRSDLPLTLGTPATPERTGDRARPRGSAVRSLGHSVKGTYGDGSALVTITTFSGDATIAKK